MLPCSDSSTGPVDGDALSKEAGNEQLQMEAVTTQQLWRDSTIPTGCNVLDTPGLEPPLRPLFAVFSSVTVWRNGWWIHRISLRVKLFLFHVSQANFPYHSVHYLSLYWKEGVSLQGHFWSIFAENSLSEQSLLPLVVYLRPGNQDSHRWSRSEKIKGVKRKRFWGTKESFF